MPLYNELPGIQVTVKDGNLTLPKEVTSTDRILILGPIDEANNTSLPDPSNYEVMPRKISGPEDFAVSGLGMYGKTNPLARAWKQAYDAGAKNIFCLPVPGLDKAEQYKALHVILSILEENFYADIVLYAGVYADDSIETRVYDTAVYEKAEFDALLISTLPADATEKAYLASLVDLTDTGRVDYTVTGGTIRGELESLTSTLTLTGTPTATEDDKFSLPMIGEKYRVLYPVVPGTIRVLYSGDGLFSEGDTISLSAKEVDFNFETNEMTFIADLISQESPTAPKIKVEYKTYDFSFAAQLAGYCYTVSVKSNQTLGLMGMKPIDATKTRNLAEVKQYIDGQKGQTYNAYLSIVGGPSLVFEIGNEPYEDSWVGAYAGLLSYLPAYSSPTSKPIPGVVFPTFTLSAPQVLAMTNKHIVVPRAKGGQLVISDALTTAEDKSDFVRLAVLRITNDAINLVREISEPYIGEPNTLARRNSLETAIKSGLNGMMRAGALTDYSLRVHATVRDEIDGNMNISMELVPAFETRAIKLTIALKPELNK